MSLNEEINKLESYVETVEQIKAKIKTVAENKNIEVLETDNPLSVLDKMDELLSSIDSQS